jgi:hypothetical protein
MKKNWYNITHLEVEGYSNSLLQRTIILKNQINFVIIAS